MHTSMSNLILIISSYFYPMGVYLVRHSIILNMLYRLGLGQLFCPFGLGISIDGGVFRGICDEFFLAERMIVGG